MANEIKDLKGFMEAVWKNSDELYGDESWLYVKDEIVLRLKLIMSDGINEADYIKQWSEHDTD